VSKPLDGGASGASSGRLATVVVVVVGGLGAAGAAGLTVTATAGVAGLRGGGKGNAGAAVACGGGGGDGESKIAGKLSHPAIMTEKPRAAIVPSRAPIGFGDRLISAVRGPSTSVSSPLNMVNLKLTI
jgi:hypothetical protein